LSFEALEAKTRLLTFRSRRANL